MKHRVLCCFADLGVAIDIVVAVHQYFGLHDRYQTFCLANGSVACQHFGVGLDAVQRRGMLVNGIDFAPFGEAGTLLPVATQTFGESVQTLRNQVSW